MPILSFLLLLPLSSALAIWLIPDTNRAIYKWINLAVSLLGLVIAMYIYSNFDSHILGYQFEENITWLQLPLGSLGTYIVNYHLGLDGKNIALLILSTLVQVIAALSSFEIQTKQKGYYVLFGILSASVIGCFVALDFFLFFIFFEFMLLPMYFLIGLWGGKNREYASIKFFIYTLVGSLFILIVLIGLFLNSTIDQEKLDNPIGTKISPVQFNTQNETQEIKLNQTIHTVDFQYLSQGKSINIDSIFSKQSATQFAGLSIRTWAFILLFLGFAIKLPMVPFHTWLPDAHVEAPTAISVILAGTLLKIGGYGFIRIVYDIFPDVGQNYAGIVALLGVVAIVWGAFNALAQQDFKRQIAFASVSHMGFVLLAIAAMNTTGFQAAIYQMFSHGILSAGLFLVVGVLYSRTGNRQIDSYQGLAQQQPIFTFCVAILFFASLGLPLFSGFIGEFFSISAAFQSKYFGAIYPILSTLGIILGAGYFLYTFKRMFLGKYWSRNNEVLADLSLREKIMLGSLCILTLVLGVFPNLIFDLSAFTFDQVNYLF